MAIPKKIRSSPSLLIGGVSLIGALFFLEKQKPWLVEGSRISPDTSRKVSLLTSPSREDRLEREQSRADFSAAAEEALLSLLSNPTNSELESALIRALTAWAAHDLHAVYSWFAERDTKLPKDHRWLGDVLVELSKTQPRKALEFGIALNEANEITYDVPPEDLLTISVRYLTAEDAIRVMKIPVRGGLGIISHYHCNIAPYSPDFDFQKFGTFIFKLTRDYHRKSAPDSVIFPSDYLIEWTKRDYDSAHAHAVAMNPYPSGTASGRELVDVLSAYAETAPRADVVERTRSVLLSEDLNVSGNLLAYQWIGKDARMRDTLLEVAKGLPVKMRDFMARDTLLLGMYDTVAGAEVRRAASLSLFASAEKRKQSTDTVLRIMSESRGADSAEVRDFQMELENWIRTEAE